jgi:signal transduction histidine kinase
MALNRIHGVCSADSSEPNAFTSEERRFVQVTGTLLAVSLELLNKEREQNELMSVVAHQTIGPLSGLAGYCDNLREGTYKDRDKINRVYQVLQSQTGRAILATRNMLHLSRLILGEKAELHETKTHVTQLLIQVAQTYQGEASLKNIRISVIPGDNDNRFELLSCNPDLLRQALSNLVDNALKYSNDNTTIQIETECSSKWYRINVHNQGIPLSGADLQRIMNRGMQSRTSAARRRSPQGTGIGLWVAAQIMELHNGKVLPQPTDEKGTTTFSLLLPISKYSHGNMPY